MDKAAKELRKLKKISRLNSFWKKKTKGELVRFAKINSQEDVNRLHFYLNFKKASIRYAFVAFCLLLIVFPSVLIASQRSRPGKVLYSLKQLAEKTRFSLTRDSTLQKELTVKFTEERIAEFEKSVLHDSEDNQLKAVEYLLHSLEECKKQVEEDSKRSDLESLKERIIQTKKYISSKKVLVVVEKIIEELNIKPIPIPTSTPIFKNSRRLKQVIVSPTVTLTPTPSQKLSIDSKSTDKESEKPALEPKKLDNSTTLLLITPVRVQKENLMPLETSLSDNLAK